MSDGLIIGYDKSDKDITCMLVFKKYGEKVVMVNEIFGNKAEELYNQLVNKGE